MKKYRYIFQATLIESLQYVFNILLGFVSFFMILFVFANLWEYIYSDRANLISGYTKNQMIWYVILTEILWFGTRNRTLTAQVGHDIKSGSIAYGINKPYHYIAYILAKHLGEISLRFIMFLIAGLMIGTFFVGDLPTITLIQLPIILISIFLGVMINSFIRLSISVLSFWMEDSLPFQWIYDKLIIVIGTMFPVEMFPRWAQSIIMCSPIYVITYGPAKLIIDFRYDMVWQVLLAQMIYFTATLGILIILYQKGVKKLNVNGG